MALQLAGQTSPPPPVSTAPPIRRGAIPLAPETPGAASMAPPSGVNVPPAPNAPSSSPIPLAAGSSNPYASVTPNAPGAPTDYTNKTIAPGAGVDRLALAKSNFENFKTSTEPEYEATLRKAGQSGAAAGQVGSGMLRGSLGDIGLARTRDLQGAENSFLNNATEGGIEDNYRNIGIAQQQQGFQANQQETAFSQAQRQQQLDEALRNGDFSRYYELLRAGESGNPADTELGLASSYGAQSAAAGASAGSLAGNAVVANRTRPLGLAA